MFYVYLIQSTVLHKLYIGSTKDLRARLESHNKDHVFSTKHRGPWRLVYYEAFSFEADAREREKQLKYYGQALSQLKRRISHSLKVISEKVRG